VGDPFSIKLAFSEVTGIPVSMGNPHFVLFVDEFLPGWQAEAVEIEHHYDFKYGTNVELVRIESTHDIEIRIFERGVGETQSSGTGSCAAAVASIAGGRAESPLRVKAPGGLQTVRWEKEVFLRGPAELVCRGEFFIG
jgi:diaminopimelate epimerase